MEGLRVSEEGPRARRHFSLASNQGWASASLSGNQVGRQIGMQVSREMRFGWGQYPGGGVCISAYAYAVYATDPSPE